MGGAVVDDGKAVVRGRQVRHRAREKQGAQDRVRRSGDGNHAGGGVPDALVVVVDPVAVARQLACGRHAQEGGRARLVEPSSRGREQGDARGGVGEELRHGRAVGGGLEEGPEGGAPGRERGVLDRGLQHRPERLEQVAEAGRVVAAAVDDGVAAAVDDVVAH